MNIDDLLLSHVNECLPTCSSFKQLQNLTVSLFEQQGGEVLRFTSCLWRKLSQTIVCNLSCQNAGKCISIFGVLSLLSCSGIYKSPSSNLGSVKSTVDHWCAGITGPAGQWNKKLRLNPDYEPYANYMKMEYICFYEERSIVEHFYSWKRTVKLLFWPTNYLILVYECQNCFYLSSYRAAIGKTLKPWLNRLANKKKSMQVCKTRTCVQSCEGWPNGFASWLTSCKKQYISCISLVNSFL